MKITKTLAGEPCSNGVTCDRIVETDGNDVVVQGRYLTVEDAAGLDLAVPSHEGLLLLDRRLIEELRVR